MQIGEQRGGEKEDGGQRTEKTWKTPRTVMGPKTPRTVMGPKTPRTWKTRRTVMGKQWRAWQGCTVPVQSAFAVTVLYVFSVLRVFYVLPVLNVLRPQPPSPCAGEGTGAPRDYPGGRMQSGVVRVSGLG